MKAEENIFRFFVMVTTANQSEIRKAYLVSVLSKKLGKKRPFVLQ